MEEFRKKLQKRTYIATFICLLAPAMLIVLQIITKKSVDFSRGIITGAFSGAMTVSVFNLVRMYSALHDKEKLKKMYINETDERNIALSKETSKTSLLISIVGLSFAALASSFFSVTISMTLAAAILFTSVVMLSVSAYYNKKM